MFDPDSFQILIHFCIFDWVSIFDSHSRKAFYLVKQFRIGDCAMCIGAIFFLILFDFGLKLFLKTISQFSRKQDSKRIQNRSINSFLRHLRVKQVTCFCFLFNFCLLHHHVSILNKSEHVCRIVSNHIRVFRTLKQVWTCLKNPIKSHRSWWISQCYAIRMLLERVKTCL